MVVLHEAPLAARDRARRAIRCDTSRRRSPARRRARRARLQLGRIGGSAARARRQRLRRSPIFARRWPQPLPPRKRPTAGAPTHWMTGPLRPRLGAGRCTCGGRTCAPSTTHAQRTLSAHERARAAAIADPRTRALWGRSRGLLRALLGRYLQLPPAVLQIVSDGSAASPRCAADEERAHAQTVLQPLALRTPRAVRASPQRARSASTSSSRARARRRGEREHARSRRARAARLRRGRGRATARARPDRSAKPSSCACGRAMRPS